jgi:hypothetical protein
MGAGTFFSKVAGNPLFQTLGLPGSHKYADTLGVQVGPNQGPYTGVAPTLAGANEGYRAGGPGATVGAADAPNVGDNAAGLGHRANTGFWGFGSTGLSNFFNSTSPDPRVQAGDMRNPNAGTGPVNTATPYAPVNPYAQAAGRAAQNAQTTNTWGG